MPHFFPFPRPDSDSTTRKRRVILLAVFGLLTAFLISVLFRLQIFEYGIFGERVLQQITVGSSLSAERGNIYDRNGNLLATNRTVWRIYISPVDIRKQKKKSGIPYDEIVARGLSELLALPYEDLLHKASAGAYLEQTVTKSADEEKVKAVLQFARDKGLTKMIHAEAGTERYYPFGALAAHTIGFTGSDNQGLFGLEAYYNSILTGTDGKYLASVDSQGIKLPNAYTDYVKAEDGISIVTTIDVFMQRELEHTLEEALTAADAQNRATGIVMNVKTGEILAMATAPTFDLNDPYTLDAHSQKKLAASGLSADTEEYRTLRRDLLYTMWGNKAINEIYEPGSTFKIVTVAAALEAGAVKTTDTFHCPGYYTVGGCRISCHKRKGHGTLSLSEGLMHSCNPVMMQSAERLGSDAFYRYFSAFGYTKRTGIDLPGEAMGLFHSQASLGSTELATASFGQRFKVSVIGQLTAVATVANDGVPVTPHLLSSLQSSDGKTLLQYRAEPKEAVISKSTADTVASILEAGVSGDGGAKNAYVEGYHIAAKTGTSEKFEILDANGNSFLRIGSCVAFAPYDDAEIAVIIVVDEPTSSNKYGSMTAAPYVSSYLSTVLPYLGVSKASSDRITVDDLVGLALKDAKKLLSAKDITVEIVGDGTEVLSQSPACGTELDPSCAKVILYTEPSPKYGTVPQLRGKSLREAMTLISDAGFNLALNGASSDSTVAAEATVTAQSLPPGSRAERGTCITISVYHTDDTD